MNKMKKALVGTALAGVLVSGAGYGTYSWFTAEKSVSGTIQNHTLSLSENPTGTLFNGVRLAPGWESAAQEYTVKNDGSMDQRIQLGLNFQHKDANGNDIAEGTVTKAKYGVKATISILNEDGTNAITPININTNAQALDTLLAGNTFWPGGTKPVLKPGQYVKFSNIKVSLATDAGNEYQGLKLYGVLNVEAAQATPTNADFPNTESN